MLPLMQPGHFIPHTVCLFNTLQCWNMEYKVLSRTGRLHVRIESPDIHPHAPRVTSHRNDSYRAELDRGCRGQPQNKFVLLLLLTAEIRQDLSGSRTLPRIRSANPASFGAGASLLLCLKTSISHSSVSPRRTLCAGHSKPAGHRELRRWT